MSDKIEVKLTYNGKPIPKLDYELLDAMENAGGNFWASGYSFLTRKRDLCFDFKKEP